MTDPLPLSLFVPAALLLNLTPGADMMLCLGQGLRSGPRAALAADAGIAVGCMVHVTVAGLGLSAFVAASPVAFEVIRWTGVALLVWLAWGALRGGSLTPGAAPPVSAPRAFRQGLAVNLANPKVILFVLAFLPPFVDPAQPVLPQFLMLGLILSLGGLVVNGAVGVLAGHLARSLTARPWLSRLPAGLYLALAVRLAIAPKG